MQVSTTLLTTLSLVLSGIVIALVLLQRPETDSAGAFSVDGGGTHTRRGAEKMVFQLTAIAGVLFGLVHILLLINHS